MINKEQLISFIERVERLETEKENISTDIKEVYLEAKSSGFDTKVLKKVIANRKADQNELNEFESILNTYEKAIEGK